MQKITIEQYIQERLDDQFTYYTKAASRSKNRYQKLKALEIGLAALVPFLAALITDHNAEVMKIIVGGIGVGITLTGGMLMLFKYQENWVTYRTTAEALKSEKYLFLTRTGPYKSKGANALFIEKVENILGDEHQKWQNYVIEKGEDEDQMAQATVEAENAQASTPSAPEQPVNPGQENTPPL
jgi:hypothetical protein